MKFKSRQRHRRKTDFDIQWKLDKPRFYIKLFKKQKLNKDFEIERLANKKHKKKSKYSCNVLKGEHDLILDTEYQCSILPLAINIYTCGACGARIYKEVKAG